MSPHPTSPQMGEEKSAIPERGEKDVQVRQRRTIKCCVSAFMHVPYFVAADDAHGELVRDSHSRDGDKG